MKVYRYLECNKVTGWTEKGNDIAGCFQSGATNSSALPRKLLRGWPQIFTRGQYWISGIVVACVSPSVHHQDCTRNNSSPVQAKITKFGPHVWKTFIKIPIVLWGDWPWHSRSTLTSKPKFTPFWTCPRDNSSPVQARATKLGPDVLNTLVKIPIVLGVDWMWHIKFNLFSKSYLFASPS